MVSSKETTPAAYLASLPPERRAVIAAVRALIVKRLPAGYVETMNWGMIAYEVPLTRFPDTYNKQPLMYLALAAQKNNYALYMTCVSGNTALMERLAAAYKAAGRKFDMGKSCLRFMSLDELPLDVIGDIVASMSVEDRVAAEHARLSATTSAVKQPATKTAFAKKPGAKKSNVKKANAKKPDAKKPGAKRPDEKKTLAKKSDAHTSTAKKATTKKPGRTKSGARKSAPKKAVSKRSERSR
jgi:hypothetical protein